MPAAEKEALRRLHMQQRDGLSDELVQIASNRITSRLIKLPAFLEAGCVAGYHSAGSEVRTAGALEHAAGRGAAVCLPRTGGGLLDFRAVAGSGKDLERGPFGIMEPRESCAGCGAPEAVLVPLVCASPERHRIGYGRGYYDRYLAGTGAVSIGLCYDRQIIKRVPHEPHDVRLDYIVTESRTYGLG